MHSFFVAPEQITEHEITVNGPDVNHIRNVLRMRPGEEVRVCTGQDSTEYRCRISRVGEDFISLEILWAARTKAELPCGITLFQGLPKGDKMELIIQKAVELGASRVVPVAMKRCVTRLDAKKAAAKVKRWNAISASAAGQSGRAFIPLVGDVLTMPEAVRAAREMDVVLVPYELAEDAAGSRDAIARIRPGDSVGIFIGPEGGLEAEEVEALLSAGAGSITLGRRILRTETAGMALLSHLMLRLELSEE